MTEAHSLTSHPHRRPSLDANGGRGYRLRVRGWDVGLEIEIERAEGQLRLQLQHDVSLVIGEPHLCLAILGKNPLRLDHRLQHDRIEGTCGNLDAFPAQNLDAHRIPVRPEVPIEVIGLADLERNCSDEIEERPVIERLTHRFFFLSRLLRRLHEDRPLRINLEPALGILSTFLELLHKSERRERFGIHPALVDVVHPIHEVAAADVERRMPYRSCAQILESDHFHVRVANAEDSELDVVLHFFADSERNLGVLNAGCGYDLRPNYQRSGRAQREGSDAENRRLHAAPPEAEARTRARRLNRNRLSASATGRTRECLVRTS